MWKCLFLFHCYRVLPLVIKFKVGSFADDVELFSGVIISIEKPPVSIIFALLKLICSFSLWLLLRTPPHTYFFSVILWNVHVLLSLYWSSLEFKVLFESVAWCLFCLENFLIICFQISNPLFLRLQLHVYYSFSCASAWIFTTDLSSSLVLFLAII